MGGYKTPPTVVNKLIERIEIRNNEKKHSHNNVKVDIYFTAHGKTVRIFILPKIICKFSFKTHQQNLNFSPYYRGVFFCYREIKCKQGVKNFEKHPNKMRIFLRIVEGLFYG